MPRPAINEYAASHQPYVEKATGNTIQELVFNHSNILNYFILSLPEEKADYAYAEGKWTVKDLLQHMIDTERIMTYRLLTFARKDKVGLPGFEENDYAASANASSRSLSSLKEEYVALRKADDLFLLSLTDEQLEQKGMANGSPVKVNSLAYIIFGHSLHHIKIIEERYL